MRFCGDIRFDIGAFWYILRKISYKGTFTYQNENNESIVIDSDKFILFWICNCSHSCKNIISSPNSKVDYGCVYFSYILAPFTRF